MSQALNLQTAMPRRPANAARRGHAAAWAMLPLIVMAMPFMDIPGIPGGAYVKPLVMPLVLLAWVGILVRTGGTLSLARDSTSRRWWMLLAWAVVGAVCMPLLIDMPQAMKGQSLGSRIVRDLIGFSAGLMCWFYLRLAIQTEGQAVGALKWVFRSFALLLPFLVVQSLLVATDAAWVSAIDKVLGVVRTQQTGHYNRIFGLAPEASMLADQLLSLYLPFTLAALLLGTSLSKRRLAGLSAEAWITVLAFAALVFSQSRVGLIALLFLVLCGWALALRRRSNGAVGWRAMVLPAVVAVLVAGVAALAGARLTEFLGSFSSVDDSIDSGVWSNVTRLGSMLAGVDMALHHPLGVGTGAFPFLFERHVPEWALISPEINALVGDDISYLQAVTGLEGSDFATRLPDAKALPVRVLAEMGLPGFLLLAAIWGGLARGCWRTVRHPATSDPVRTVAFGALLSLLTMLPLSLSVNSYLWVHWILVATLATAVGQAAPSKPRPQRINQPVTRPATRRRVLVVHVDIYHFGGAENHAVKVIRILQDLDFEVTVLHAGGSLDAPLIQKQTGVSLDPQRVRFIQAPIFRRFPKLAAGALLLRYAFVLRAAHRLAGQFDLVVGTYGETPVAARILVQSMQIPLFFFDRESLFYLGVHQPRPLKLAVRRAYVVASRLVAGWSRSAVTRGVMLANSRWTAGQFSRHYPQGRPQAIYLGVHTGIRIGSPLYLDHAQRDNTIVVVGRVVPFKRVHMAIEIVDQLRALGHDLNLLIVGKGDGPYVQQIQNLVSTRPHTSLRGNLPRAEMEQLIARQRWGLHCAAFEHYGLAPLELQRLGCVTFVHDSGGQAEAVRDEVLKYRDVDDAVRKMDAVMKDRVRAAQLFAALPEVVAGHDEATHREAFIAVLRESGALDA